MVSVSLSLRFRLLRFISTVLFPPAALLSRNCSTSPVVVVVVVVVVPLVDADVRGGVGVPEHSLVQPPEVLVGLCAV